MNAGLIVILLLLVLSVLGIPIYLALGIGTLVALNCGNAFYCASAEAFCRHEFQFPFGNPVFHSGREYYVPQYYE